MLHHLLSTSGVLQYATEFMVIDPQQTFDKSIFIDQVSGNKDCHSLRSI